MFAKKSQNNPSPLEALRDDMLLEVKGYALDSDEYIKIIDQIVKVQTLIDANRRQSVSPDTIAMIVGNLAGIGLILSYERVNVIASKAVGFVLKLR